MGDRRDEYRVLLRKPEGKKQLGIPRRRWEYDIRMVFKKWDVGAWT